MVRKEAHYYGNSEYLDGTIPNAVHGSSDTVSAGQGEVAKFLREHTSSPDWHSKNSELLSRTFTKTQLLELHRQIEAIDVIHKNATEILAFEEEQLQNLSPLADSHGDNMRVRSVPYILSQRLGASSNIMYTDTMREIYMADNLSALGISEGGERLLRERLHTDNVSDEFCGLDAASISAAAISGRLGGTTTWYYKLEKHSISRSGLKFRVEFFSTLKKALASYREYLMQCILASRIVQSDMYSLTCPDNSLSETLLARMPRYLGGVSLDAHMVGVLNIMAILTFFTTGSTKSTIGPYKYPNLTLSNKHSAISILHEVSGLLLPGSYSEYERNLYKGYGISALEASKPLVSTPLHNLLFGGGDVPVNSRTSRSRNRGTATLAMAATANFVNYHLIKTALLFYLTTDLGYVDDITSTIHSIFLPSSRNFRIT